jgi:MFS family permease
MVSAGKSTWAGRAFRFVLVIGVVNMFADMTYEGARAVTGAFLGALGASATVVGFVAGFGELAGYGLRSFSGYFADRTRRYWTVIFSGYAINMLAVPALALAGHWPLAAVLIVAERTGRAIRRPAVEALLSDAGKAIGQGWVFGLNEAMDQAGATVGPLITALVLYRREGYHHAFALLLIPALLCLGTLVVARAVHPAGADAGHRPARLPAVQGFSRAYWLFLGGAALIAAGFADFSLVAFHFQKSGVVGQNLIAVFYSAAMAAGAIASLVAGRLFDKLGWPVLMAGFFLSAWFAPLVFLGGFDSALVGAVLWGIGLGVQDSLLKAVLAGVLPAGRRSTGFGIFDTGFGIAWFLGSAAMGALYVRSIPALVILSVFLQIAALPVFFLAHRDGRARGPMD